VKLVWVALVTLAAALSGACDESSDGTGSVATTTTVAPECATFEDCEGPGDCECQSGTCACVTLPTVTTTSTTYGECSGDNECSDAGVDCFCEFATCHCAYGLVTITLVVDSDVPLGALQITIGYAGIDEDFLGTGDQVECEDLTSSLSSFNDDETARVVTAGFVSIGGFGGNGPLPLLECRLQESGEPPEAADFNITVVDAADVSVTPVNPLPIVRVSRIDFVPPFP
jgi:hypothetical protein